MPAVWNALARALSPIEDRPRLAAGLECARFVGRSAAEYVVLHNPATRAYARLDPREFELLPLLDGKHTVKELVVAYYQRFNVLALPRVVGLVRLLREHGVLQQPAVDAYAALAARLSPPRRRRRPELVSLELDLDLDAALGRAYHAFGRHFFRREALVAGLLLGALNVAVVPLELTRGRYAQLANGPNLLATELLLVSIALFALAVHELGHGLAVKHAGRRVHVAGLRLYYGLPAAYVDTSDVWLAAPRLRLLTAFAGPWTGLVLGGCFSIAAALLPTGPLGALCFTAAGVFLVDNIFNFNPLLELDGYYVLIDFLDWPMLRPRAMAFVRGPLWRRLREGARLTREEAVLTAFGLGSFVYTALVLLLALRAWQALLLPLAIGAWNDQSWFGRTAVVLILLVVAFALINALRHVRVDPRPLFARARRHAAARRHRQALAALEAVPFFGAMPRARLLELAGQLHRVDVHAGDEVVRQGDVGKLYYVIAEGTFEVLVDGRPAARLGRGDYFGERALLHRRGRAATVVAVTPGRLFTLDQATFDALLAHDLVAHTGLAQAIEHRAELAEMSLFKELTPAEFDLLLARMRPLSVASEEVVVRQGEPGQRFYVVQSGAVDVERDGAVLARLGPGEAFGEIALLLDVPRTATVRAATPTRLLALDADDFRDLLASYLGRANELQRLSNLRLCTHKRLDEIV